MDPRGVISLVATARDRANRLIAGWLRKAGIRGLAPAHGAVLVRLFGGVEMPMGEMARRIHRDKSTVTTLVAKLAALGYLRKRQDPDDGRVTLIRLTPKGEALRGPFETISRKLLTRSYRGFSAREREQLVSLLARMRDNLDPGQAQLRGPDAEPPRIGAKIACM